jgi:hypothetical protein
VALGRAGPGIAGVGVLIPGQQPITASFANGWYLVWWPGEWPKGTIVAGFDSAGRKVAETPPCVGSSVGCGVRRIDTRRGASAPSSCTSR